MNLMTIQGVEVYINSNGISDAVHGAFESNGKLVTNVKMLSGSEYYLYRDEFDKLFAKADESDSEPKKASAKK